MQLTQSLYIFIRSFAMLPTMLECTVCSRDTRATGTCQNRRLSVQPPPPLLLYPTPPALMWSDCRLPSGTSRMGVQRWLVSVTCSNGAASQGRPCLSYPKPTRLHMIVLHVSQAIFPLSPCNGPGVRSQKNSEQHYSFSSRKGKKLSWWTAQKHVVLVFSRTPCTGYGVTTGKLPG